MEYVWCCDEDDEGLFTFEVYDSRNYFPEDDDVEGFLHKYGTIFMLETMEDD